VARRAVKGTGTVEQVEEADGALHIEGEAVRGRKAS